MKCGLEEVAVAIVTYKGDGILRDCLDSIRRSCGDEPRIVVVDNDPNPSTRSLVAGFQNTVYVPSSGNPGFAGGNNRAVPFCDRRYMLLLNNDTLVHTRESFEALVDFMEAHPQCATAQGTMTVPAFDGRLGGCGSFLTPAGLHITPGMNAPDSPRFRTAFPCFSTVGAFMIVRRSAIAKTGGFLFRTHFWSYYEETDFCHRAWLAGYEVWYVPTPPVDHLLSRTSSLFKRHDIMRRYLRNMMFGLNVNLSAWSRIPVLFLFKTLLLCHALAHALKRDMPAARTDLAALADVRRSKKRILAARRAIAKIRKTGDLSIFRKTMRLPTLKYALNTFFG